LREVFPRIEAAGGEIVVVLCQDRDAVARWLEANPFPAPIVTDENRSIAKAWGVYHPFGIDAFRIARPASFLVDGSGVVRFAFVASNQFQRAGTEALATEIETLRSGAPRRG